MRLLVVAGEPSGDRALAAVVRAVSRHRAVESFGFGGDALAAEGTRLVAHVRDVSGLGLFELAGRAPSIARALMRLSSAVNEARPDVAVLASWSSGNARIGARLRKLRIPVVWVSPPEVWAWREGRARRLATCADRFAVTLPFEEALWRAAGADATYVGHPALDQASESRDALRRRLGIADDARAIAIMPGSRPAEIARLAEPFARALPLSFQRMPAIVGRLIVAPSLPDDVRAHLRSIATAAAIPVIEAPADGAVSLLPAFDAALVASGTASLECTLSSVPPVIAYRLHTLTMAIAKRVVRTPHIALPNVVLTRAGHEAAFHELVQDAVTSESLATALFETLSSDMHQACALVRSAMSAPLRDTRRFEERVAAMVLAVTPRRNAPGM